MNEDINMEDVLKDMGWTDGFSLPVANEENRALELEIQKKQKEKDNLKSSLEDVNERLSAMKKHLIHIQHEFGQNQSLIVVQQRQMKNEENMMKSAQSEESSLTNDMKRMKKECDEIFNRHNNLQVDIDRVNAKLEKLKGAAKWDQDALLAWDEEVSRGYDDMIMLEKFTKEDEIRFNELELRRQNLRMELENKRFKVTSAKNDLICMEQSLERTAQLFRKQHADRKALVQQWEASVRVLHQRDEDINRTIEEIGNLKVLAKGRFKEYEEHKSFYDTQVGNNKEIEKEITTLGTQSSILKENLKVMADNVQDLNGNLMTVQNVLDKVTRELESERHRKKQLTKDMQAKLCQIENAKNKLNLALEELGRMKDKSLSTSDRVQRLEEMFKDEQRMADKFETDTKKLNELMFQVTEQARELSNGEITQKQSIANIQLNISVIKKHLAKARQVLNRQKELMYNMDFQYTEKDILLGRMLGFTKGENSEKYEKKIQELEECHAKLIAKNAFLTKEVNRLEEEMRRLSMDMQYDSKELDTLLSKRQDNVLLTECGMKQLKAMKVRNQDLQVDENVLKLRVRQAEKLIDKVGGKLYSLEKQRLELEEAMKEREIEIKALRDVLIVRRRILNEQANSMTGRINLAKLKVDHLKNKYDVTVGKLGTDPDGQPVSLTYFKIKSAQERFELQEIGDKLDAKIKRTEKEITAMENTLKVVNASNKAFRNSLKGVDPNSPELLEKEEFEKCLAAESEELRREKAQLEKVNEETVRLEEIYNEQLQKEKDTLNSWSEKKRIIAQIEKEIKDQEEKLLRAEKQLKKLVKEIRGTLLPKFQTIEEKDIELRELMEQNQSALQQYAELVAKTIDTGPVVIRYLSEKGIDLPVVKSPSESIKYASTTSLLSPCSRSTTSRSSENPSARSSSSCMITPSVVTLDSSRLDASRKSSSERAIGVLPQARSSVRFHEGHKNEKGEK